MYKQVNVFLPDEINELYTINDQIHNHFKRQCNFFILIKDIPMFTQKLYKYKSVNLERLTKNMFMCQ